MYLENKPEFDRTAKFWVEQYATPKSDTSKEDAVGRVCEMGFDREKFLLDYDIFKCDNEELKNFELYYSNNGLINKDAVDPFIGKLVAIIADPNVTFDYSNQLKRLQNVDLKLFQVITNLFKNWNDLKIKDRTLLDNNYIDVMNLFMNDLKEWKRTNRFN